MMNIMNLKQLSLFFILAICLQACKKENNQGTTAVANKLGKNLPFEIDKEINYKNFDSILKKDRIIKLETNKNSLISSISKIEFYNNKIYVIDAFNEYSVSCFDKNGKFKFKLKKIGRGPDEYIQIDDANINMTSGDIELLDGRKLMVYDSLGSFKKTIKLPYFADKFCSLSGIRFFYKNFTIEGPGQAGSFRLYSINSDGVLKKYLKFDSDGKGEKLYSQDNFTRVNNNEYRFFERYNDTIYKITPQGISSFYKIDFLGYENKKPKDFLSNQEKYPDKTKFAKNMAIPRVSNFFEFDNSIFGLYMIHIQGMECAFPYIFDKKSNKLVENKNRWNDLGIVSGLILPNYIINKTPITYIVPSTINNLIEDQKNPEYKKKIKAYFEYDDNINANPYIIVYKPIKNNEK